MSKLKHEGESTDSTLDKNKDYDVSADYPLGGMLEPYDIAREQDED